MSLIIICSNLVSETIIFLKCLQPNAEDHARKRSKFSIRLMTIETETNQIIRIERGFVDNKVFFPSTNVTRNTSLLVSHAKKNIIKSSQLFIFFDHDSPVYNCNLPTGIPIPNAPRSPRPRIRSPSVTTMALTCSSVQLHKMS